MADLRKNIFLTKTTLSNFQLPIIVIVEEKGLDSGRSQPVGTVAVYGEEGDLDRKLEGAEEMKSPKAGVKAFVPRTSIKTRQTSSLRADGD